MKKEGVAWNKPDCHEKQILVQNNISKAKHWHRTTQKIGIQHGTSRKVKVIKGNAYIDILRHPMASDCGCLLTNVKCIELYPSPQSMFHVTGIWMVATIVNCLYLLIITYYSPAIWDISYHTVYPNKNIST